MKTNIFSLLLCTVLLLSCGNKSNKNTAEEQTVPESETFALDAKVVAQEHITMGQATPRLFAAEVRANGTLRVTPQSEASVASPIGANVKRIFVVEGQRVKRGQTLALVSHPDLLDLQGRYLAASSRMSYVAQEYRRIKSLYASKIGSGKDFQQITSEYRQLQGELNVTGRQLSLLGVSLNAVKAGRTVDAIAVKSPINGTVETVAAMVGQYADPQLSLFTIVNTDHIYADVLVYESDLDKVTSGSHVVLTTKSAPGSYEGKVVSVGNMFDGDNRAVHVRVAITSSRQRLVPGAYVTATLRSTGTRRLAVPNEALAADGDRRYLFLAQQKGGQTVFTPRRIHAGQTSGGFTEIVSGLSPSETVVLSGAYTLMSQWKKADAEHE